MGMKLPASVLAALQQGRTGNLTPPRKVRVLGIDTSLRSTGVGIIDAEGSALKYIDCRPIKNPASRPLSACLLNLCETLHAYLDEFHPDEVAIEGIFYCKNVRTTLILGQARGALISVCARAALPLFEYPPTKVKQAVTGTGTATKDQIQRMMMRSLSLQTLPQEDAGDALAIAITHIHNRSSIAALAPKPL